MRFVHPGLEGSINRLRAAPRLLDRAKGDNFAFEERVAEHRQASYEAVAVAGATTGGGFDLDRGHAAYVNGHVQLKGRLRIPSTFHADNAGALMTMPAEQVFVRIEKIGWVADLHYPAGNGHRMLLGLMARRASGDAGVAEGLRKFVDHWNQERDARPMFAASLAEVRTAAMADDWAVRLRAQLGLSDYAPRPGETLLLAQMRYTVADVRSHALPGQTSLFAAPTAVDGPMNAYFYPAPRPRPGLAGSCGRTVHLDNTAPLVAELLTARIDYRPEQIHAVVAFTEPLPATARPDNIARLRNGHLARLRAALECPDFAEPMRV